METSVAWPVALCLAAWRAMRSRATWIVATAARPITATVTGASATTVIIIGRRTQRGCNVSHEVTKRRGTRVPAVSVSFRAFVGTMSRHQNAKFLQPVKERRWPPFGRRLRLRQAKPGIALEQLEDGNLPFEPCQWRA